MRFIHTQAREMRVALVASLVVATTIAAANPIRRVEVRLPDGISSDEFRRVLDDDLGAGMAGTLPVALLEALCELAPEKNGRTVDEIYERFGFSTTATLPTGITERTIAGVRLRNYNCFACHAGAHEGELVIGAPAREVDFTGFYGHVLAQVHERLAKCRLEGEAELVRAARRFRKKHHATLSPVEAAAIAWWCFIIERAPARPKPAEPYGPGRVVVVSAYRDLRFGMDPGPFAPAKPPDLFGVPHRKTLLWTGNERHADDVTPAERMARNGLLVPWIQAHPLTGKPAGDDEIISRIDRFRAQTRILALGTPPPARLPADCALHARGRAVYARTCARCHGDYEQEERDGLLVTRVARYDERLVPLEQIETDPSFAMANDRDFQKRVGGTAIGKLYLPGMPTFSYVARPLLGLRMRFPFLHNASVPSLRALLTPPGSRPRKFLVGADAALDERAVGYDPDAPAKGPRVQGRDTSIPGSRATGHAFGTSLSSEDKDALIEYLRSL